MKVIFAGTPQNAALTLRALVNSGIDIVGVLTRIDAPVGRKRTLEPSPVALEAQALGIRVIRANSVDERVLKEIADLRADLGLVVAYGSLLDGRALAALSKGWINLHYSLLPKYRGAAPVQRAILNGEKETGVSVFQLEEGMDTGPVLTAVPTIIEPGENSLRLLERLTALGISALLETLPAIAAGIAQPIQQDGDAKSFAPKISRADAKIDWTIPARKIEQLINAMNPEPMAWTTISDSPIRILAVRETQASDTPIATGSVVLQDGNVVVGCENSNLLLLQVQPAGKLAMSATDWLRGQKNKDDIVLGT